MVRGIARAGGAHRTVGRLDLPRLVPAINDDALSLTIANSASSQLTLTVMLIIAAIGVPLVLFYFYLIYKIFAGKTQLGGEGY